MIEFAEDHNDKKATRPVIKVVGIGGAGGNAVNHMIESKKYDNIDFIAANTDTQALEISLAPSIVRIGVKSTKGLGTGANPELGKRAAEEDMDKVLDAIGNADIVFLTAGMGGGTGTGGIIPIARALKDIDALTIAVVTKPFMFEGRRRAQVAEEAINTLKKEVDALIIIPNQKLLEVAAPGISVPDAFAMINDVLSQSVKGIYDLITRTGRINVDYADVRAIMKGQGIAVMGTGKASGKDRAQYAALDAISSRLLENMSIEGAQGILLNITGSSNLGLHELSEAASVIYEQADKDANIILGSVIDHEMNPDEVHVMVIATGFTARAEKTSPFKATVLDKEEQQILRKEKPAPEYQASEAAVRETVREVEVEAAPQPVVAQAAPPVMEEPVVVQAREAAVVAKQPEKESAALVDVNNLDVPTFLRNKAQENMPK